MTEYICVVDIEYSNRSEVEELCNSVIENKDILINRFEGYIDLYTIDEFIQKTNDRDVDFINSWIGKIQLKE